MDKDSQCIEIPRDAEILSAQNQNENMCIWVKLKPNAEKIPRIIEIYETGQGIKNPTNLKFIGSVQLDGNSLVLHIFERLK